MKIRKTTKRKAQYAAYICEKFFNSLELSYNNDNANIGKNKHCGKEIIYNTQYKDLN